jgi:hypothetical protein
MAKQTLLKTLPESEYPDEFLVARLRGKRGALFHDWEFLLASSDAIASLRNSPFYPYLKKNGVPGIWQFLRTEHLWVYSRMNKRLRTNFSPYFIYHEIYILLICLRFLSMRKTSERILPELRNSLLHNDIQEILRGNHDFTTMLHELELRLCAYSHHFAGLLSYYGNKGFPGLEGFIRGSFFAAVFSMKLPVPLKTFYRYLVDFYNCVSTAKALRWMIEAEPLLMPGGTVPPERFTRAYFCKDLTPVFRFLRLNDPEDAALSLPKMETSLLRNITFKLKTLSYQRTIFADILFCLWEQYRYTRNISTILQTVLLDDELVRESLIA